MPAVPDDPAVPCQPFTVNCVPGVQATATAVCKRHRMTLAGSRFILEFAASIKVPEPVMVLVAVMFVVLSIPPFNTTGVAEVEFAAGFSLNSPAVIVVAPVLFVLPVKISRPGPALVIPPAPLKFPPSVNVFALMVTW